MEEKWINWFQVKANRRGAEKQFGYAGMKKDRLMEAISNANKANERVR